MKLFIALQRANLQLRLKVILASSEANIVSPEALHRRVEGQLLSSLKLSIALLRACFYLRLKFGTTPLKELKCLASPQLASLTSNWLASPEEVSFASTGLPRLNWLASPEESNRPPKLAGGVNG